jgi:hypothetical protein
LLVFPEPVGVMAAERSLRATANSARWTRVTLKDPRLLRMTDTSVMVIYKAVAYEQGATTPYSPLAASAHVREGDSRRLAFHQQTLPFAEC